MAKSATMLIGVSSCKSFSSSVYIREERREAQNLTRGEERRREERRREKEKDKELRKKLVFFVSIKYYKLRAEWTQNTKTSEWEKGEDKRGEFAYFRDFGSIWVA